MNQGCRVLCDKIDVEMAEGMGDLTERKEWVDWMNVKVLQKAVVVDESGNMLVTRRAENRPGARPGKWDLSGGSMSPEDLSSGQQNPNEQAIKREVLEETGLHVSGVKIIHAESGVKKTQSAGDVLVLALGYKCVVNGTRPEVALSDEHTEYKWISRGGLEDIDFGDDGGFHKRIVEAV